MRKLRFINYISHSVFSWLLFAGINALIVEAQVIPDGTLPTVVEQLGNMDKITGGERVGNNLFHSFEQFSVPTGMEAVFENAADIENIFTRITGSDVSFIDGLLKTQGEANFFLLNPNGIVFGENARLDVGGSFIATTANSVVFADGTRFGVNDSNQKPLLTINQPIGLDFWRNNGSITVNGSGNQITNDSNIAPIEFGSYPNGLSVNNGQTLALVGNSINFNGGVVTTEGGNIYLGSVESGTFGISQTENELTFSDDGVTNFQDIILNQQSLIDASGETVGNIFLSGENINLNNASFLLSRNQGNNPGGEINVKASESITMRGNSPNGEISSNIRSEVLRTAEGTGTNLNISGLRLILQDRGAIQASTFSDTLDAEGGDINISSSENIKLDSGIIAGSTLGKGDAGNLNLSTSQLQLTDFGLITSTAIGSGNGGEVTIDADLVDLDSGSTSSNNRTSISASSVSFDGNAGNITITTEKLRLTNGASLSSSSFATGNAGDITINASESVEVSGINQDFQGTNTPQSIIRTSVQVTTPARQEQLGLPAVPTGDSGNLYQFPKVQLQITQKE